MKLKKMSKYIPIYSLLAASSIGFLTSCSTVTTTILFSEVVVSDNTAVLKDKSFNESTYNGWRNFMMSNEVDPTKGEVYTKNDVNYNNNNNEYKYTKPIIDMPDINDRSNLLKQGKGYWRRSGAERSLTFKQIFKGGANLVIGPGFNHQSSMETVSRSPGFKDKGFILLDGRPDGQRQQDGSTKYVNNFQYQNISSFLFRAEQSGFLAGIATAEFLNINHDIFDTDGPEKNGDELVVGGFVGLLFPTTIDFLSGFQHGIIAYNLEVDKMNNENQNKSFKRQKVKWIGYSDVANYASGSFAAGEGIGKTQDLISKKADAIMPIAGAQSIDTVSVINKNIDQRPIVMIGVDSAQENSPTNKPLDKNLLKGKKLKDADMKEIENPQIIQFSAIKKIDEATTKILAAIFNKKDPNNQSSTDPTVIKGLGYNNIGSLGNATVGLSDAGLPYIKNIFNDWFEEKTYSSKNGETKKELILKTDGIYKNVAFQRLEYNGSFYYNNNLEGEDFNSVENFKKKSDSWKSDGKNQLFSPLLDNQSLKKVEDASNTQPTLSNKEENPFSYFSPKSEPNFTDGKSLDGSNWSYYKSSNKQKNIEKKEEEIDYSK